MIECMWSERERLFCIILLSLPICNLSFLIFKHSITPSGVYTVYYLLGVFSHQLCQTAFSLITYVLPPKLVPLRGFSLNNYIKVKTKFSWYNNGIAKYPLQRILTSQSHAGTWFLFLLFLCHLQDAILIHRQNWISNFK